MNHHSIGQLQGIAKSAGTKGLIASKSQIQIIRSIQQRQNKEPCFATNQTYCCGNDCEWRDDCLAISFS